MQSHCQRRHGLQRAASAAPRPSAALALALSAVAVVSLVWLSPSAASASAAEGSAAITQLNLTTPLDSGGSSTEYGVELPSGAKCPGDSAHDGYRVYTYLIPKGVSLTSLSLKGELPFRGTAAYPYYGYVADGTYYGGVDTDEFTGQISTLPSAFTWSRLTPSDLFAHGVKSAVWEGGIACATADGTVTNYWNSEIEFTASSSDPGGFTWTVLHRPASSIDLAKWISVGLIILAIGFGANALVLRRRQREASNVGS
jgi:hypothetical protein